MKPHSLRIFNHPSLSITSSPLRGRSSASSSGPGVCLLRVDLLAILVVSDTWWGSAVAAAFSRTDTNDLAVDGAGHAVLKLQVHLGDGVLGEDRGIGDITDSSRFDHVADRESLDCLVLRSASRAVGATDRLDVAAALLVAAVGRSLFDHVGQIL